MHNLCILLHIFGYYRGVSVCICMTARSELRRCQKNEKTEKKRALSEKQIQFSPVLFLSSFPVETRNSGYNCDFFLKIKVFYKLLQNGDFEFDASEQCAVSLHSVSPRCAVQ